MRLNDKVVTPDGQGLFIAPYLDPVRPDVPLCLVALSIPAREFDTETIRAYTRPYATMPKSANAF